MKKIIVYLTFVFANSIAIGFLCTPLNDLTRFILAAIGFTGLTILAGFWVWGQLNKTYDKYKN